MFHVVLNFPDQMKAASAASIDPDVALYLYQGVKHLPGTETCANLWDDGHISINGPSSPGHTNVMTAVDLDTGSLLALKLLPPASQQQKDAAKSEKRAVNLLKLDTAPVASALVPTQIHSVRVSPEHAKMLQLETGLYDALTMPWYTATLQQLPQLSHELLYRGGRRLQQAVAAMHEVKLLHTDLKAANVFVDSSGAWFLGDFGVSNIFGDKIRYCT